MKPGRVASDGQHDSQTLSLGCAHGFQAQRATKRARFVHCGSTSLDPAASTSIGLRRACRPRTSRGGPRSRVWQTSSTQRLASRSDSSPGSASSVDPLSRLANTIENSRQRLPHSEHRSTASAAELRRHYRSQSLLRVSLCHSRCCSRREQFRTPMSAAMRSCP